MGELLLCGRELASVPYYIESISLNVYSLEEICYYLKEYIDLVEGSFMDKELIRWIGQELKQGELADKLTELKEQGGKLIEFVNAIVSGCNYCTPEECKTMAEKLAIFENKTEIECKKIRADRLLEKKRYQASILAYQKLLEHSGISGAFAGDIYHNLGTAYAGMFLFEDAAESYGKAFQRNQNPISGKQRRVALQLAAGIVPQAPSASETDYQIPEDALEAWKEAYIRHSK